MKLPLILPDANKYTRGSVLIVGGSARFSGAPILAAMAAARTGAGYVSLAVPASVAFIAQTHLLTIPVIAALELAETGTFAANALEVVLATLNHCDALLCGPGMTLTEATEELVSSLLLSSSSGQEVPAIVLDADALNALAKILAKAAPGQATTAFAAREKADTSAFSAEKAAPGQATTAFAAREKALVLTPHGGELKRLLEASGLSDAASLARYLHAIVVAKGPKTYVTDGDQEWLFSAGTAALAKAGTGDVLAGIIVSLLAEGASAWDAACMGVELHGLAATQAEAECGKRAVIARDIINMLPKVLKEADGV